MLKSFRSVFKCSIHLIAILLLFGCTEFERTGKISFSPTKAIDNVPEWEVIEDGKNFKGICFNDAGTEGWAVGAGIIYHFEKGSWKKDIQGSLTIQNQSLTDVSMQPNGEVWAIGSGVILHYVNGKWKPESKGVNEINDLELSSIASPTNDEAWAVGQGTILHFTGTRWEMRKEDSLLVQNRSVSSIAMYDSKNGWAVGYNNIFRCINGKWEDYLIPGSKKNKVQLSSVAVQKNGDAWVIGLKVLFHFTNNKWEDYSDKLPVTSSLFSPTIRPDGALYALDRHKFNTFQHAIDVFQFENGNMERDTTIRNISKSLDINGIYAVSDKRAWLIGNGIMINYLGGGWKIDSNTSVKNDGKGIKSVSAQLNGNAWLVGRDGVILNYVNGHLVKREDAALLSKGTDLNDVFFLENGQAWAVGDEGVILYFDGKRWNRDERAIKNAGGRELYSIDMLEDGTGWIVGEEIILQFKNGSWERHNQGSKTAIDVDLERVVIGKDSEAWAIDDSQSNIFRYDGVNWNLVKDKSVSGDFGDIAFISDKGTIGLTTEGDIFRYSTGKWEREYKNTVILFESSWTVAAQKNGNLWAVNKGQLKLFVNNKWEEDVKLADLLGIEDLFPQKDGSIWGVGSGGAIVKGVLRSGPSMEALSDEQSDNLIDLKDSITFKFSRPVYDPTLTMTAEDDQGMIGLNAEEYEIPKTGNDSLITIKFKKSAKKALDRLKGHNVQFKLQVKNHPSLTLYSNFTSNFFPLTEPSAEQKAIKWITICGLVLIALNVMFLFLAIRFSWFRRNVFGDDFSALIGIFSIKGTVLKPFLIWIKPLKFSMLKEYRDALINRPDLNQWKNKTYNPPQIGDFAGNKVIDLIWEKIEAHSRNRSKKSLWLIEGRSGLGKTALLEQLTLNILSANNTPIFLKLSGFQSEGISLKKEFDYHGQLVVDAGTAERMVKSGGFFILLDGLNEAQDQESVKAFVKSIIANNTIIITSQFVPEWSDIDMEKINLKPFGKEQLEALLDHDEALVEKVLNAGYLFDIYNVASKVDSNNTDELKLLPFTAFLIADYIKNNRGLLPPSRLAIHKELLKNIRLETLYANLEKKAWEMFRLNSQDIEPDNEKDNLDTVFLNKAVQNGILTKFTVKNKPLFRFRHERIFRFVVASYIYRQPQFPKISKLHLDLDVNPDKVYWIDVIEYLTEFYFEEYLDSNKRLEAYKMFILETAGFSPKLIGNRLYFQWKKLNKSYLETEDVEFERKLISILLDEEN